VPVVEDRTQRKRWIISERDLRVYKVVLVVLWIIFSPFVVPVVVVIFVGEGGSWVLERAYRYIIRWLAGWVTAILLNKRKEYPQVFKMDVQGGE